MFCKRINCFCGYAFFVLGVLRIILVLIGLFFMGNAVMNFLGESDSIVFYEPLEIIGALAGLFQILLGIISIIMIFLNKRNNPEVVSGYLYALGAFLLGIISSIFTVFLKLLYI